MISPRLTGFAWLYFILALLLGALALLAPARAAGPICTVSVSGGTYASVAAALADPDCTTIQVAAGTFQTNVFIRRPVVIEGAGPASTRLDGGGESLFLRVVTVEDDALVELRNLALINGDARDLSGGGLSNTGTLTLTNVLVQGNIGRNGGGISNDGTLAIIGGTVLQNRGGIVGGIVNHGTLIVRDSVIANNQGDAGAIINAGALTLVNTTVSGNTSFTGPAVSIREGAATVEFSMIIDNRGEGSSAGSPAALLANSGTAVSLRGSALLRNGPGPNCGGAITSRGGNLADDASCGAAVAGVSAQIFLPKLQQ